MPERLAAFGPGRVNLIGEHTDYNGGLSMPFAIERGVTVTATPSARWEVDALDFHEHDEFSKPKRVRGWRSFHRGMIAELQAAGYELRPARLVLTGDLPRGSGLSSSAALEAALALALLAFSGHEPPRDLRDLAKLCSRVENEWVGAETGLLDQVAALFGGEGPALRPGFRSGGAAPRAPPRLPFGRDRAARARARRLAPRYGRLGRRALPRRLGLQRPPARVP